MFSALFGAMKAELPGGGIGDAPPALGTEADIRRELGVADFRDIEVHEHRVTLGRATPAKLCGVPFRAGALPRC